MAKSKSTTKSSTKKSVSKPKDASVSEQVMTDQNMSSITPKKSAPVLRWALILVLIGLLVYKFGPWLVPAMVEGRPITRLKLWDKMEQSYGAQTLDDLVNERVLDRAIAKSGVKVDPAKVDEQITNLEKQFESVGGLDEALKQRGLTRQELRKQVVTQLSVEEILKDRISVTDEEISAEFEQAKDTLYKDKKLEDVKDEVRASLRDDKLRESFLAWFDEVKKDIKVKSFGL